MHLHEDSPNTFTQLLTQNLNLQSEAYMQGQDSNKHRFEGNLV